MDDLGVALFLETPMSLSRGFCLFFTSPASWGSDMKLADPELPTKKSLVPWIPLETGQVRVCSSLFNVTDLYKNHYFSKFFGTGMQSRQSIYIF